MTPDISRYRVSVDAAAANVCVELGGDLGALPLWGDTWFDSGMPSVNMALERSDYAQIDDQSIGPQGDCKSALGKFSGF